MAPPLTFFCPSSVLTGFAGGHAVMGLTALGGAESAASVLISPSPFHDLKLPMLVPCANAVLTSGVEKKSCCPLVVEVPTVEGAGLGRAAEGVV